MPAQVVVTLPRAWLLPIVAAACVVLTPSAHVAAQQSSGSIQVLPVRGNIYVLQGAGANITVSIGRDGKARLKGLVIDGRRTDLTWF